MHDLNNDNSSYEFSVRSIWNSLSSNSKYSLLGHVEGTESGIDYIDAGMDHYPTEQDFSTESAYQQDFSRKISSYSRSKFDSLPSTVRSHVSNIMVNEGFPTESAENSTIISTEGTFCDKCDMELGTEEDLEIHNSTHEETSEDDLEKSQESYDYIINGADSDLTQEKIIQAREFLRAIEKDEVIPSPRDTEIQPKHGTPTKEEPDDVKGKVGMNYNPNAGLYDYVSFQKGSSKNRGGVKDLSKDGSLGEKFTGDIAYKTLSARERDEARFGILPSRIYDKFNITDSVESHISQRAIDAYKTLKALEAEAELTCPHCDTKYEDKTELEHHKKEHVEENVPSFLTDPIVGQRDDADKVGGSKKIFAPAKTSEAEDWKELYAANKKTTYDAVQEVEDDVPEFLKGIDFTKDKEQAGEAIYLSNEDIDKAINADNEIPEGYNEEDKVEKEDLKEMIVERKLEGHPDYTIIRQVELYSNLTRDSAEELVQKVYPSDIDYESYSLFGKRHHELSSEEVYEMKLYGGEAMTKASESYTGGKDDRR